MRVVLLDGLDFTATSVTTTLDLQDNVTTALEVGLVPNVMSVMSTLDHQGCVTLVTWVGMV